MKPEVPEFLRADNPSPKAPLYTTRQYPCGCRAEGSGDVPAYCPENKHGAVPSGATNDPRKAFPLMTFLTAYFPDVIEAVVELCTKGQLQHCISVPQIQPFYLPGDRISWDRAKSTEELESLMRHLWDHTRAKRSSGSLHDSDGVLHIVKAFWRAGAEAQRTIESLRHRQSTQEN